MREIKFRAWDSLNKKMITPNTLWAIDSFDGAALNCRKDDYEPAWKIMQYTGLKDKHRKEIYEGDIVKWFHGTSADDQGIDEVIFKEGCFFLGGYTLDAFSYPMDVGHGMQSIEIIGNVYQNPELLGGKS